MGKPLGSTGEFFRRRDEWRKHPMLTNQFRHATPGLGIALVAFGVYLVGEQFLLGVYHINVGNLRNQEGSAVGFYCGQEAITINDPFKRTDQSRGNSNKNDNKSVSDYSDLLLH
ncbi:hypothetical protein POTOM_016463 [Populus tomentosa]|uniref:Uncharacterized protein n=1 Tax=Populus tomentosa TaxID=118781 RepID=A0A8X8AFE5_POPTO|nr:hypothetical protein POTOM_016463 [Populus tomentosa]